MEKVYIETTIPSYLTSELSNDIMILSRQIMSGKWWNNERINYELFVSQIVLEEIRLGDAKYSDKRLKLIEDIPVLERLDYDFLSELVYSR